MQNPSWIALFERIPAKWHDSIALILATGTEILMQSILRLESDYAIIRGRMAGSTDAGRVLILPYDQIVNVAFTKRMLEPEVQAIFGKTMEASSAPGGTAASDDESAAAALAEPEVEAEETPSLALAMQMRTAALNPSQPAAAQAQGGAPAKNAPPSKSILLARLRARLAEQGK